MVTKDFESLKNNYYTFREVENLLSRSFIKKLNPIIITPNLAINKFKGCKKAYLKDEVNSFIPEYRQKYCSTPTLDIQDFGILCDNYYTYIETCEKLTERSRQKIKSFAISNKLRKGKFQNSNKVYLKVDVDKLAAECKYAPSNITLDALSTGLYISTKDVRDLLQICTNKKWLSIKKAFNLTPKFINYYLKSDVYKIYDLQKLYIENYLSVDEVKNIIKKNIIPKIQKYKIPDYAFIGKFKNKMTAYNSLDIFYCIFNGYAKDEYYIKNNLDLKNNLTRRKNIIITDLDTLNSISFDDFNHSYYTFDEVNDILVRRFLEKANFITVPKKFKLGKFQDKVKAYNKNQILKLKNQQFQEFGSHKITSAEVNSGKYMSFNESCELLEIHRSKWLQIRRELNIKEVRIGYTLRKEVLNIINEYNLFLNKYCSYEEATDLHPSSCCNKLSSVNKVLIPSHLKIKTFYTYRVYAYSRSSLKKDVEMYENNQLMISNSYNKLTAMQILNLISDSFEETVKELHITSFLLPNETGYAKYYKKLDIDNIKDKQQEFLNGDEYINYNEALDLCKCSSWIDSDDIVKLKIKIKPWNKIDKFNNCIYAYPKQKLINVLKFKESNYYFLENINLNDPVKSFREKLLMYPYFDYTYLSNQYPFATMLIHDFCEDKILDSKRSPRTLNILVRSFVKFSASIYEMLERYEVKDLHMITTENIMEFLLECTISNYKYTIPFFNFVYFKIVYNTENSNICNKKIFDIDKINKNFKSNTTEKELLDADIYDLDVFLDMIEYCQDIELHTSLALDEINKSNRALHVSYWLFVSINLNNAWRTADISTFPSLDMKDLLDYLQIYDLNWFKNNSLSLCQARIILSRLSYHDYIVAKTKEYNGFFISDDLAPSVATAIIILTLFKEQDLLFENNYLMQFETDFNYAYVKSFKKFFLQYNKPDFVFVPKKTTTTLLTFISAIQTDDCSEYTLALAQNIRAHKKLNSLLNYIKLNPVVLDTLTKNLFNRGEFGYIYATIANKLNLPINTLKDPSGVDKVILLKDIAKSPWDYEILAGEMNSFEKKSQDVLAQINKKTFNEIQECFASIVMRKNPSKEKGIECFVGFDNCMYKGGSCIKCEFSIFTLVSLNSIAKKIVSLLLKYEACSIIGEKIKLSHDIFYYKKCIIEAINTYGIELVYSYMQISREDFLFLMAQVKDVNQLNKEGIYHIC